MGKKGKKTVDYVRWRRKHENMYGKSTGNGELKREELTKGGWTNVGRERKGE